MQPSAPWLIAGLSALLILAAWSRFSGGSPVQNTLSVREAIDAGATIVDVRSPEEFRGGAYPGALNIPLQSLQARLPEIPRDKPVVLYCASGGRSAAGASLMKQAGYPTVINAGGLFAMPR
ncbi:MAG: rhodanese-like domain-containing protein [bacterium]|nr:rhodanese-like domain-containing protein [bacterium]